MNAAPLANSSSRGAIAILHDITPSEHLERVKRDFIANVSHEFRTPLATIRGYAETLLDGGLEDRENRRKFVEIIQANGIRLNNIAADLLTLSDLEAGRPEPEPTPISLRDAIASALHAAEPAARLRGLTLHAGEIPEACILGYGIRLEQALLNLLDNAVKFNRENGEVGIEVARRPEETHRSDDMGFRRWHYRRPISHASSSASTAWIKRVPGKWEAPGWACPSSSMLSSR